MTELSDTRERIIGAARELFHARGYTAVGVADICAEADVVKGSFYHFFASKDELLAEALARNWQQLESWLAAQEAGSDSGRRSLEALFDLILAEARRTHRACGLILGCRIGTVSSELGPQDPAAAEAGRKALEGWRQALRRLVRKGQADGSIDENADALELADGLLASIQGMSVIGRTLHQPAVLKRIAASALRQVPEPGGA